MRELYEVGVWKNIIKGWDLVGNRVSFEVENRGKMKFWKNSWCTNSPLCASFPYFYVLASSKEVWDDLGKKSHWNPRFAKHMNDWELDNVETFFSMLQRKGSWTSSPRILPVCYATFCLLLIYVFTYRKKKEKVLEEGRKGWSAMDEF